MNPSQCEPVQIDNHDPMTNDSLGDATPALSDDKASNESFFTRSNLQILIIPLVCGLFYGYNIVFVAVYYEMHLMGMDCARAKGQTGCETLSYSDCRWFSNTTISSGYCGWTDITCRVLYPSTNSGAEAACNRDDRCQWSYRHSECQNPVGFDALHYAIFAASMTTGGAIGSFLGSCVVQRMGSKLSFLLCGILACACSVMLHVGIDADDYWVIIAGRVVTGICVGITGVASPLYMDQNAPKKLKRPMGYVYMISICTGQLACAVMGLAVGQSVNFSSTHDLHLGGRVQAVAGVASLLSFSLVLLGIFTKETCVNYNLEHHVRGAIDVDPNEYNYAQMLPRLMIGFVMACTYQLTGANSISSYAPTIMGNLGLAPLVGTFLMMLTCLAAASTSMLLSTRASSRTIFLAGAFSTGAVCVFLCGVPVYPGVAPENVKNIVAVVGTLMFMGFFQLCLGPCFYVLTQEVFPLSFRPKGASFTQTCQFSLKVMVVAAYPFATQGLSGGVAGNQNKGQAIVFTFFGVVGLICFTIEYFFLYPWAPR